MQQAAGRFLEQLLRHVTVAVARTGLALPAAAWGLSLCLSGSITTNPDGGNLPQLPGTRWALWHLRDDSPWASVGSKEAEAAQDNNQEAACSVPDTPGKEENQGQEGRCWKRR